MDEAEVERSLTFLKTGQYSDVRVIAKDKETENTRVFKCHKIILATKSAEFEHLVDGYDKVHLLVSDLDIIQNLLHYIYTNSIKMMSTTQVVEQINVANKLKLTNFQPTLVSDIQQNDKFVLYRLEFARMLKEKKSEEEFVDYICKNTKQVLKSNFIENVAPETIMWLLDQDNLNLNSDYLLLEFLARYRDEAKPTDAFMQEARRKIRFLNISKTHLIELNERVKIVNECEMFFIEKNLDNITCDYAMPAGFSTNRQKRSNQSPQKKENESASTSKSSSEHEPCTSSSDSQQEARPSTPSSEGIQEEEALASTTRRENKTLKSPRKKAFSKISQKKGKSPLKSPQKKGRTSLKSPRKKGRASASNLTSDSSQEEEAFASTSKKNSRVAMLTLISPLKTDNASTSTSTIFSEDEPFSSTSESQQEEGPSTPNSESPDEEEEPSSQISVMLSKAFISNLLSAHQKEESLDTENPQEEGESSTSTSKNNDDDN